MTDDNRDINVGAELQKASQSLRAADQLIDFGLYDDAMSRLYYGVFHLASCALLAVGIEVGSHKSLQSLFALHLVKPGLVPPGSNRTLSSLIALRHQADYSRHFAMDQNGACEERARAEELIVTLRAFLRAHGHTSV
jgi:uncharacterized protein (UPF0332 family)